ARGVHACGPLRFRIPRGRRRSRRHGADGLARDFRILRSRVRSRDPPVNTHRLAEGEREMSSQNRLAKIAQSTILPLLLACFAGVATSALAQSDVTPLRTKLAPSAEKQIARPPTGPYRVVVEHDPGLPTHTIYRPSELSLPKHPV